MKLEIKLDDPRKCYDCPCHVWHYGSGDNIPTESYYECVFYDEYAEKGQDRPQKCIDDNGE